MAQGPGSITLSSPDLGSCEVLAWSWGVSQSGSLHTGGGGGTGKPSFQDISLTRVTDEASPLLIAAVARGDHLMGVELTTDNVTISLHRVIVTSYSTGGAAGKKEVQTENITLNFDRIRVEVGGQAFCWDIAGNAPCQ